MDEKFRSEIPVGILSFLRSFKEAIDHNRNRWRSRRGSMVTEDRSRPSEVDMSEKEVEWYKIQ
jgi:hypothetical protein